ncbi:hypothetical protein TrRE_jg7610 [Triparma retinervis]|uniref:Uncharacterized protein n=1 Tax=Triparma retinervis TaxID=2557542 RepID=A0A9W6ZAX1_9STRA|nr:hypothetical protein TrRE_jg7610 [Triparma retinervis]
MSGLNTGEQKQAAMARDRAALKSLFESASNNNVPGCIKAIQPYVNLETSTFEALAQFKDGRERTVLHFAAQSWAKDVVAWIKELVDGEKVNKEEKTRFINGKDEKVKLLLDANPASVNKPAPNGLPPLVTAAAGGLDGIASVLISSGADCGVILGGNVTIAHIAGDNGMVGTLRAMGGTETGRKAMGMDNEEGESAAELAAGQGYGECVKVILEATGEGEGWERRYEELKEISDKRVRAKPAVVEKEEEGEKGEEEVVWEDEVAAVEEWRRKVEGKGEVTEADKEEAGGEKGRGNGEFGRGNYKDAVGHYGKAITADPTERTYYSNRCACHLKLKDYPSALADAAVVREMSPEWNKGIHRLASARMGMRRYQAAAEAAWEGLKVEPGNQDLKDLMQKAVKKGREENKKMGRE